MTNTVVVTVPNILEAKAIGEDFTEFVEMLNKTAQAGQEYLIARKTDGLPIAVPVHGLVIELEKD